MDDYHDIKKILEKKESPNLSNFLYCLLKTKTLFNKRVICYFH